jgi:protein-S-isoprenylcysteine O-methyltransferase Ste14
MLILLTGFLAALFQLGLAVLGWGGLTAFFAHPAFIVLVAVTFALCVVALFTKANLSTGEQEDRSNRWVFVAFAVLAVLLAWLPAYTDRLDRWVIDGAAMRWTGIAVYILGGVLRLWPVFVLGRRFSGLVAIQPDHSLATTGPYRHIRNPSYLGLLLGSLGWALVFRSIAGIAITALLLIPLVARINAEERLLAARFGATYAGYRGRTWRLLPGIY